MPLIKKINLKRYFFLTALSTLILFLLSDRSLKMLWVFLSFLLLTSLNQIMLMGALKEMLKRPFNAGWTDRLEKGPASSLWRRWKRSRRGGLPGKRDFCGGESRRPGRKRQGRAMLKARKKRRRKNLIEMRYHGNLFIKRKNVKIVFLVIGKLLVLIFAIGLGVHFIQDRIIFPVINYVVQIIALALSVRRG